MTDNTFQTFGTLSKRKQKALSTLRQHGVEHVELLGKLSGYSTDMLPFHKVSGQ